MSQASSNQLFATLYFDEDVSVLVSRLVRARGFTTLTTHEAQQNGAPDAGQLEFATERGMAILTHNRSDFERLAHDYINGGKQHHGMIIAVRRPPYELARRVLTVLNRFTADEMIDQVLFL